MRSSRLQQLLSELWVFGLYEWKRLPFGWKNAPSVFQRTIRRILSKHKVSFACNYFDDIIIFSNNFREHLEHSEKKFHICREENIKLKQSKCKFAQTKTNFLGYEVEILSPIILILNPLKI